MTWSIVSRRAGRWSAVAAALVLGTAFTAGPVAAGGADAKWAWATFRSTGSDTLLSQGKSAGAWNAGGAGLHRVSTGDYQVTLYGALSAGAGAHVPFVTPIGTTARTCAIADWSPSGGSLVVEVLCQTLDGDRIDSGFVLHWLAASGVGGRLGYGFNWSPTSNCGSPLSDYSSNGSDVRTCPVTIDGKPMAEMRFIDQGTAGGVALVTATDRDRVLDGSFPTSCTVARWAGVLDEHTVSDPNDDTFDERVDVRCWETDDTFNIYHEHITVFLKGLGLKGIVRDRVAYLVARMPSRDAPYTPSKVDRYSSSGGRITIDRTAVGRYTVRLGEQPTGGGAQVSALAPNERRVCTVAGIGTNRAPAMIKVACFDKNGTPKDTRFVLAWTR
jgi:hypothetical protein